MKRITLALATLLCFSAVLKAQTHVNTLEKGRIYGIPGCFTNNGHSNVFYVNNENGEYFILDNDFTTILLSDFYDEFSSLYYIDFSAAEWLSENGFQPYPCEKPLRFTQSLFNSDDYYEYVTQSDSEWTIKATSGTTIQTIYPEDGYETYWKSYVIRLDNCLYLGLIEKEQGESISSGKMLIYRVDQGQGLTKVDMQLPISVFPTMPAREEQITMELGEGTNVTEITVVNGLGQVVKRVPVEEGQRTVTIPANELGSGLNVVNARNSQGQGSCKIIVR